MDYQNVNDGRKEMVIETEYWVAVVPYWAVWPFEILLLPKIHVKRLTDLNETQAKDLGLGIKNDHNQI